MPKPITLEMLHAMDPDQRKTLHKNASAMDTPASRAVLELLAQDDLMVRPKTATAKTATAKSSGDKPAAAKKPRTTASKPKTAAAKPIKAVYGRQA